MTNSIMEYVNNPSLDILILINGYMGKNAYIAITYLRYFMLIPSLSIILMEYTIIAEEIMKRIVENKAKPIDGFPIVLPISKNIFCIKETQNGCQLEKVCGGVKLFKHETSSQVHAHG